MSVSAHIQGCHEAHYWRKSVRSRGRNFSHGLWKHLMIYECSLPQEILAWAPGDCNLKTPFSEQTQAVLPERAVARACGRGGWPRNGGLRKEVQRLRWTLGSCGRRSGILHWKSPVVSFHKDSIPMEPKVWKMPPFPPKHLQLQSR